MACLKILEDVDVVPNGPKTQKNEYQSLKRDQGASIAVKKFEGSRFYNLRLLGAASVGVNGVKFGVQLAISFFK
jgi:hypothetical protein